MVSKLCSIFDEHVIMKQKNTLNYILRGLYFKNGTVNCFYLIKFDKRDKT